MEIRNINQFKVRLWWINITDFSREPNVFPNFAPLRHPKFMNVIRAHVYQIGICRPKSICSVTVRGDKIVEPP